MRAEDCLAVLRRTIPVGRGRAVTEGLDCLARIAASSNRPSPSSASTNSVRWPGDMARRLSRNAAFCPALSCTGLAFGPNSKTAATMAPSITCRHLASIGRARAFSNNAMVSEGFPSCVARLAARTNAESAGASADINTSIRLLAAF